MQDVQLVKCTVHPNGTFSQYSNLCLTSCNDWLKKILQCTTLKLQHLNSTLEENPSFVYECQTNFKWEQPSSTIILPWDTPTFLPCSCSNLSRTTPSFCYHK